jgi:hypothetical protein
MLALRKLQTATPDTIRQELLQTIEHLLQCLHRESAVLDDLQEVRDLLDSLPLASDEYATAFNRLRNAHRYLVSQERGAARYELQLLAGSLRCEREVEVRPRRRRQRSDA